jgi:hypothetical protein
MKSAKAGNVAMPQLLALQNALMPCCCFWAGRRMWLAAAAARAATATGSTAEHLRLFVGE